MSEMGDMKFTTAGNMMKSELDKLVEKYDNQTKLEIAAWVISKIDEHGADPGSFAPAPPSPSTGRRGDERGDGGDASHRNY